MVLHFLYQLFYSSSERQFLDTTSSLLSFVSLILTEREDVVAKLREEIDTVLGDREIPEYEDVSKFHYCRMVLHETLRMCPPVPTLHRRVAESFTIEGFEVPAGVSNSLCL